MSMKQMLCTLGRFDIPIIQMQPDFSVDLLESNILLYGAAMSGKSTFLKTLINILHKRYTHKEEQIFVLDFGGALASYREFPLVSAYFDNSNEEYVKRVFKIMDNILKDNVKELDGKNFRDAQQQPIHTTFIIDNLNAFIDEPRYQAYQDKLAKLCRDGISKGITVVVTAVETKGTMSYLGSFKQKIAFEMPSDKYSEIFNGKVGQIGNNPGHGFANVTVRPAGVTGSFSMNLPYEVQCVMPYKAGRGGPGETEEEFISKLRKYFDYRDGRYMQCVKKYMTFPKELTAAEYENTKQQPPLTEKAPTFPVSVGLDYVDFYPVTVDLDQSHVIAIYGKKEFGKTNLLKLFLKQISEQKPGARMIFFDDGRNQLKELHETYQGITDSVYFNGFAEETLKLEASGSKPEEHKTKKLSPLQRFYLYLHENYIDLPKNTLSNMFGVGELDTKRISVKAAYEDTPYTVFVIQSKLVYLNTVESRLFIERVLPRMAAVAEDRGYLFILSDVQKISELETNTVLNSVLNTAFLLDNIAEFAGERGQKTVFGSMDVKTLKEDYARCEIGDGYHYDIEADRLLKAKFIKCEED